MIITNIKSYTYENLLNCTHLTMKESIIAGYILALVLPHNKAKYSSYFQNQLNKLDIKDNFFYLKLYFPRIIEENEETKVYCIYTAFQRMNLNKKNYNFILKLLNKTFLID